MDELSLFVVGAAHPNLKNRGNRQFEILICVPGEHVLLVPDPNNLHDENAIAVFSCRNIQIGYLTAERAPWIGGMIRQGRLITAIFQETTSLGAAVRVAFDGKAPTLPPTRKRPNPSPPLDHDSGFYPDYIPPDD